MRIALKQLSKAYGVLWALRDINLDLRPGDFVALLGPNGAGKTTLLKLIAGLIEPTSGTIDLEGKRLVRADAAARAEIGLLAPAGHLYDSLTARENLRFFTSLYRRTHGAAAIDTALEKVDLLERADDYAASLSSGMKCRLSIAKWRLLQPELLLLDEPYGVLDGNGVALLETFLKEQCASDRIVVMASHHVARVLRICSRAVILHRGRLTFDAPRREPWPEFGRAFGEYLPRGESWDS